MENIFFKWIPEIGNVNIWVRYQNNHSVRLTMIQFLFRHAFDRGFAFYIQHKRFIPNPISVIAIQRLL